MVPLIDEKLSLGFGAYLANNETHDGTDGFHNIQGVMFHWRPSPNIEVIPFWNRSEFRNDERGPIYVPAGSYLPPRIPLRRFAGPDWADFDSTGITQGIVGAYSMSPDWLIRAGLFWSELDDTTDFVNLLTDLQPDGSANRVIIADPQSETSSTSGEFRLSRSIREGTRQHLVHLSFRGRDRAKRYGGSDSIDFGPTTIYEPFEVPEPLFQFAPQSEDRVRQLTGGLAYEGRWPGRGELSFGASYTDYEKQVLLPGAPGATTGSTPWLYYGSVAANVSDALVVYASYTEGLEESGVAPDNAVNRNQPLPAILTNQREIGLRYAVSPSLTLVTGLFDLNKPYYNLDQNDVFTLLGDIRNRGLEISFSGALTSRLNIVAGAVLLDPEVTGEGVSLGRIGNKPVGLSTRTVILNADWKMEFLKGLSFDLAASYAGRIITTRDNLVSIPPRTLVDIGGRYRFQIASKDATLRFRVTNLTDKEGFVLQGAGSYDAIAGRVASVYLAVDF
jgi:iron complex outermembrane receptor protein